MLTNNRYRRSLDIRMQDQELGIIIPTERLILRKTASNNSNFAHLPTSFHIMFKKWIYDYSNYVQPAQVIQ